jgi:hypothetical protein
MAGDFAACKFFDPNRNSDTDEVDCALTFCSRLAMKRID